MVDEESKSDVVKEARELLRWAAPGPWRWTLSYEMPSGRKHWALTNAESTERGRIIDASLVLQHTRPQWLNVDCPTLPNWQLIVRAPELLSALCSEVEQLKSLHQVQQESIQEFQSQQRATKEAIEVGIEFIEAIGRDIHYVYSPEAAATVQRSADETLAQLRSAITPRGSEQ